MFDKILQKKKIQGLKISLGRVCRTNFKDPKIAFLDKFVLSQTWS